jgi:hypothetical protein
VIGGPAVKLQTEDKSYKKIAILLGLMLKKRAFLALFSTSFLIKLDK